MCYISLHLDDEKYAHKYTGCQKKRYIISLIYRGSPLHTFFGKAKKKNHPTKCKKKEIYSRSFVSLSSWPLPHFCSNSDFMFSCFISVWHLCIIHNAYLYFSYNLAFIFSPVWTLSWFSIFFSLCLLTTQTLGIILCLCGQCTLCQTPSCRQL